MHQMKLQYRYTLFFHVFPLFFVLFTGSVHSRRTSDREIRVMWAMQKNAQICRNLLKLRWMCDKIIEEPFKKAKEGTK